MPGEDYFFVLAKDGNEIADWLRSQDDLPYKIVPNNNFKRLKFELFELNRLIAAKQIDILYIFFGTLFRKPSVKLVMGCAYSNLFYPKIDFWRVGPVKKRIKKVVDWLRLKSYQKADLVIFENQGLAQKAYADFDFQNVKVLLPSIAISSDPVSKNGTAQLASISNDRFNLIMLSGWHVNKNIDKLVSVARILKEADEELIVFNLSLSPGNPDVDNFIEQIKSENLLAYFNFLGRVSPTDVRYIVEKNDAVLLISTLESFSNNIIESWAYQKPLIITDAEWSRGACQTAACYVDITDPGKIVEGILSISKSKEHRTRLIETGLTRLKEFPSPPEKVEQHLAMLKEVYEA